MEGFMLLSSCVPMLFYGCDCGIRGCDCGIGGCDCGIGDCNLICR